MQPGDSSEDKLVRLRYAVQGTLATARSLKFIDETEFEEISNQTIEAMTPDVLLRLSTFASWICEELGNASQSREILFSEIHES